MLTGNDKQTKIGQQISSYLVNKCPCMSFIGPAMILLSCGDLYYR